MSDLPKPLELLSEQELQAEINSALAEFVPLMEAYGFAQPERAARLLLVVFHLGRRGNTEAAWRRGWTKEIKSFLAAPAAYLESHEHPPAPLMGCSSFSDYADQSDMAEVPAELRAEAEDLIKNYTETSWATKSPNALRRISWDLADLWEAGTKQPALAWRDSDVYDTRGPGGRFYAFVVDVCAIVDEPAPKVSAVEAWLRERRDHDGIKNAQRK